MFRREPVLRANAFAAALAMGAYSVFWTAIASKLSAAPFQLSARGIALFALAGTAPNVTFTCTTAATPGTQTDSNDQAVLTLANAGATMVPDPTFAQIAQYGTTPPILTALCHWHWFPSFR